jgi:hypothetical protein
VVAPIEEALVYPLIRGRDVHRWQSSPSAHILVPYDRRENSWIEERRLKRDFPNAFEFLLHFKSDLQKRKTAIVRQAMERGPFYSMVAVSDYTFAPWKVVYKRLSNSMQAAVIPAEQIPHEKLILIPTNSRAEAHYLAALLNSSPAGLLLRGAAVRVQTIEYAPSDVAQIKIPLFSGKDPTHTKLADLSEKCHSAKAKDGEGMTANSELEIDDLASELWGISKKELRAMREALETEDKVFASEVLEE